MTSKPIHICLAVESNYAPMALVTINSIIKNTKEELFFHIISSKIQPYQKEMMSNYVKRNNVDIEFIDVEEEVFSSLSLGWFKNYTTYLRWLIPELLHGISKIIYTDADVVFNMDILELYNTSVDGYGIAAVQDQGMVDLDRHYRELKLPIEYNYFNAGILVMNCDYWRKYNVTQELFRIAQEKKKYIWCPSQDPMNIYFSQKGYFELNRDFNYMPHQIKNYEGETANHKIFHYTLKSFYKTSVKYTEYFWINARETPYYETILMNNPTILNINNLNKLIVSQQNILKELFNYSQNKLHLLCYKFLSKITLGGIRRGYKKKYKELKSKLKNIRRQIKGK